MNHPHIFLVFEAVGIVYRPPPSLQCQNKRGHTHTHTPQAYERREFAVLVVKKMMDSRTVGCSSSALNLGW